MNLEIRFSNLMEYGFWKYSLTMFWNSFGVFCNISLIISDSVNLGHLFLSFGCWAKDLSCLLIFSKSQLLDSSILVLFTLSYFINFCSDFLNYFLLSTRFRLGLLLFFQSSSCSVHNVGYLNWSSIYIGILNK